MDKYHSMFFQQNSPQDLALAALAWVYPVDNNLQICRGLIQFLSDADSSVVLGVSDNQVLV